MATTKQPAAALFDGHEIGYLSSAEFRGGYEAEVLIPESSSSTITASSSSSSGRAASLSSRQYIFPLVRLRITPEQISVFDGPAREVFFSQWSTVTDIRHKSDPAGGTTMLMIFDEIKGLLIVRNKDPAAVTALLKAVHLCASAVDRDLQARQRLGLPTTAPIESAIGATATTMATPLHQTHHTMMGHHSPPASARNGGGVSASTGNVDLEQQLELDRIRARTEAMRRDISVNNLRSKTGGGRSESRATSTAHHQLGAGATPQQQQQHHHHHGLRSDSSISSRPGYAQETDASARRRAVAARRSISAPRSDVSNAGSHHLLHNQQQHQNHHHHHHHHYGTPNSSLFGRPSPAPAGPHNSNSLARNQHHHSPPAAHRTPMASSDGAASYQQIHSLGMHAFSSSASVSKQRSPSPMSEALAMYEEKLRRSEAHAARIQAEFQQDRAALRAVTDASTMPTLGSALPTAAQSHTDVIVDELRLWMSTMEHAADESKRSLQRRGIEVKDPPPPQQPQPQQQLYPQQVTGSIFATPTPSSSSVYFGAATTANAASSLGGAVPPADVSASSSVFPIGGRPPVAPAAPPFHAALVQQQQQQPAPTAPVVEKASVPVAAVPAIEATTAPTMTTAALAVPPQRPPPIATNDAAQSPLTYQPLTPSAASPASNALSPLISSLSAPAARHSVAVASSPNESQQLQSPQSPVSSPPAPAAGDPPPPKRAAASDPVVFAAAGTNPLAAAAAAKAAERRKKAEAESQAAEARQDAEIQQLIAAEQAARDEETRQKQAATTAAHAKKLVEEEAEREAKRKVLEAAKKKEEEERKASVAAAKKALEEQQNRTKLELQRRAAAETAMAASPTSAVASASVPVSPEVAAALSASRGAYQPKPTVWAAELAAKTHLPPPPATRQPPPPIGDRAVPLPGSPVEAWNSFREYQKQLLLCGTAASTIATAPKVEPVEAAAPAVTSAANNQLQPAAPAQNDFAKKLAAGKMKLPTLAECEPPAKKDADVKKPDDAAAAAAAAGDAPPPYMEPLVKDGWKRTFNPITCAFTYDNIATRDRKSDPAGTPFQKLPLPEIDYARPVTSGRWQRRLDPKRNRFYYADSETRTKTWKFQDTGDAFTSEPDLGATTTATPAASPSSATAPASSSSAAAAVSGADPGTDEKNTVQKGDWVRSWVESKSRVLYKNVKTSEKQWSAADTTFADGTQGCVLVGGGASVGARAPSSATRSNNDIASPLPSSPTAATPISAVSHSSAAAADPTVRLQKGDWKRLWHAGKSKHYYSNKSTGETTYDKEKTSFSDASGGTVGAEEIVGSPAGAAATGGGGSRSASSPAEGASLAAAVAPGGDGGDKKTIERDGWKKCWNKEKGKWYYSNIATTKSQYSKAGTPFENDAD